VIFFFALTLLGHTGAAYDAHAHTLSATGAAAADLRAPSAEVARVKAERDARAQAEKRLSAGLAELGGHEKGDALKALLDTAQLSDETYGSDGSVSLKLTLSTKALDVKR
jgi:hypothetical protein